MKSIRGVNDFFGLKADKFHKIVNICTTIACKYNFQNLITPIIESSSLFERSLGDDTDVVSKEIYKFLDKGGDEIALRPEFTAGVVRAFCENHELRGASMPVRLFSYGSLFRYERPQSGRYRQFNQVNFEIFGKNSYQYDIEILLICNDIVNDLKINNTILNLNFIGGIECKYKYIQYLNEYFEKYKTDLSNDSKERLNKGKTLRILDSKDEKDKEITSNVKSIFDFHSKEVSENIVKILSVLDLYKIKYDINPNIVRGLDYYTDMVFEYTCDDLESKSQKAILGGGRYDKMVHQISGGKNDVAAIGFALGIERLMAIISDSIGIKQSIAIISMNNIAIACQIRDFIYNNEAFNFTKTEIFNGKNLSKLIKKADELDFDYICIVAEDEIKSNQYKIKGFRGHKKYESIINL